MKLQCLKCGGWFFATTPVSAVIQSHLDKIGAELRCLSCGWIVYWDDEEQKLYPTKGEWIGSFYDVVGIRHVICAWCGKRIPATARRDSRFCDVSCRQSAWRLRVRSRDASPRAHDDASRGDRHETPLRFAYADPPYPGTAAKYYRNEPTYAGEVDHAELVKRLASTYDGWALSTSAKALRAVLSLCPSEARVCAWIKPHGAWPKTWGLHNVWEPIVVVQGRRLRPGVRDAFVALPARGGGTLPGRKPIAFCAWLFSAMGMRPGDSLDDLFPGTGIVGRAWKEVEASLAAANDA